ncbi:hypothetical protein [Halopseudomonas maritima]|uniref:hypothetical protein n=1 Tax=Halopseudomonas maritima TaxID=2918528 RepID=UPI001EEB82B2|nr:hypothetical protein [Halopseudomonas maritima]UJJ32961.1 hypothetical protein HV822_07400 [Halopseudomonas maritima]
MNSLTLCWQAGGQDAEASGRRLQVLVDDQPLTAWVRDYELACDYHPFAEDFLLAADVDWYSLTSWQRSAQGQAARLILLGCRCGDVDCSQLYADTQLCGDWVLWRIGGWPQRDYRGLGPFWFEWQAYRQQVQGALESR